MSGADSHSESVALLADPVDKLSSVSNVGEILICHVGFSKFVISDLEV